MRKFSVFLIFLMFGIFANAEWKLKSDSLEMAIFARRSKIMNMETGDLAIKTNLANNKSMVFEANRYWDLPYAPEERKLLQSIVGDLFEGEGRVFAHELAAECMFYIKPTKEKTGATELSVGPKATFESTFTKFVGYRTPPSMSRGRSPNFYVQRFDVKRKESKNPVAKSLLICRGSQNAEEARQKMADFFGQSVDKINFYPNEPERKPIRQHVEKKSDRTMASEKPTAPKKQK